MATLPKTNLRLAYHVACTIGETYTKNGVTYLNTDLGTLSMSDKVNMWSKNKPVVLSLDAINHIKNGGKLSDYPNWQKGADGTYGIKPIMSYSADEILNGAKLERNPPLGNDNSPFVLGMFAGYNHEAIPFLMTSIDKDNNEKEVNIVSQKTYTFGAMISLGSEDSIGFDDFGEYNPIGDSYFCVLMYTDGITLPTVVTAEKTLNEGDTFATIDLSKSPWSTPRTWTCVYCLRTDKTAMQFYPIPWSDRRYYKEIITFVEGTPFLIVCEKFSGTLNGPYSNISDFAFSSIDPSQTRYYPTSGPIYFLMEISSKENTELGFSTADLRIEAITYGGKKNEYGILMYDSDKSQISGTTINSTPKTIYIGSQYALNPDTATPSGTKYWAQIKIKYRGQIIFATGLNITYP